MQSFMGMNYVSRQDRGESVSVPRENAGRYEAPQHESIMKQQSADKRSLSREASKANLKHRPATQERHGAMRPLDTLVQRISQENLANQSFIESIKPSDRGSNTSKHDMRSPSLHESPTIRQASPARQESTRSIKRRARLTDVISEIEEFETPAKGAGLISLEQSQRQTMSIASRGRTVATQTRDRFWPPKTGAREMTNEQLDAISKRSGHSPASPALS